MAMNITRATIRGYNDSDVLNIYKGSDNVERIEPYGAMIRVVYNDGSFLIYPIQRVLSLGGNIVRDDIWDADPRANSAKFNAAVETVIRTTTTETVTDCFDHDDTCRHEDMPGQSKPDLSGI